MKSLREHLEFTNECYSFILDFIAMYHAQHPEESCGTILDKRTMFRFIQRETPRDPPANSDFVCLFINTADAAEKNGMDAWREAMERLRPKLLEQVAAFYPASLAPHPMFPPGCSFRFDEDPRPDMPPTWCVFHMTNALRPKSFLGDPDYMAAELRRIMDESEKLRGCDTLCTGTWLNSHPRFLAFFPEEWRENLGPENWDFANNLGVNGQFLDAAWNLNRKTADYVLETGTPRYPQRPSHCSFMAMRKHLEKAPWNA